MIRHMHLWLSKERGHSVQPHGSNCESWCYCYVNSSCNHALLVLKGSMASSITKGSNLRRTHHTQFHKKLTQSQLTTSSIARRGLWGRRRVGQRNSNDGWGSPTTLRIWQRRGGQLGKRRRRPLVMMGSHLYRRKTRSMKVWI
jgi:hypothetical protein